MPSFDYQDKLSAAKASSINATYQDVLRSPGGLEKVSARHESQLASYIREACVLDKPLPPQDITEDDCEVGPVTDTLFYRVHMDTETRAFMSSFEGLPREVQELYVPRVFVGFLMVQSPKIVANEYNMATYPFPVTKQVEEQIGMDMHEAKDHIMHQSLEEALRASTSRYGNILRGAEAQADILANGTNTGFRGRLQREDFSSLKAYYPNNRARLSSILVPEEDYIRLELFKSDDFGDGLQSEVFVDGYERDRVHGVKIIRTIKGDRRQGDTFLPGNIYGFADPRMIGRNFNLRSIKFYVERDHQFLYFDAQMSFGFLWAVTNRLTKLELYNGGRGLDGAVIGDPDASNNDPAATLPHDALWQNPEDVTFKDYFDVQHNLRRPRVSYE